MPVYVYRCRTCGQEFEKLVLSVSRAAEVECPSCQGKEIERRPCLFGLGAGSKNPSSDYNCAPSGGGG
jgi:putative FmdB family regulatory protein